MTNHPTQYILNSTSANSKIVKLGKQETRQINDLEQTRVELDKLKQRVSELNARRDSLRIQEKKRALQKLLERHKREIEAFKNQDFQTRIH